MRSNDCVVILAGGEGSRLKPFTNMLPKPLIPIGDVPILEVVIRQLRRDGFRRLILAVNYLDGLLRSYFGDGSELGVDITYSKEDRPLGTIGPLHLIADDLPESFLVMNGDILTDLDYRACLDAHVRSGTDLTLVTSSRQIQVGYGVAQVNAQDRVTSFEEKPTISMAVSTGVYAMNRSVLKHVPRNRSFGMDDLLSALLDKHLPVNNHSHPGEWYDIGCPQDLEVATGAFAVNRETFLRADGKLAVVA